MGVSFLHEKIPIQSVAVKRKTTLYSCFELKDLFHVK